MAIKTGSDATVEDFEVWIAKSELYIKRCKRIAMTTSSVLLLFAFLTFLCTTSGPFHKYWSPFGVVFDLLSMAALLPATWAIGTICSAWSENRKAKRDYRELMEDRHGVIDGK